MARTFSLFMIPVLVTVLCAPLFAQDVYYVQSVRAKVLSRASFKSGVLGEVGKGFKFVSSGREGNWMKVTYGSREGYVSALLLAAHPPIEKQGLIKGREAEIKQNVRRRASTYTSAAAARGLTAADRKRLNEEGGVNYESLEKVESFSLSQNEIDQFIKGGKP
jgi:uncharacterized protein YgiM (DUF1202 family)